MKKILSLIALVMLLIVTAASCVKSDATETSTSTITETPAVTTTTTNTADTLMAK